MAQDFGFTVVLGKQAHSRLRNCFSSAAVGTKDKSDSGIIEFSFLLSFISHSLLSYSASRNAGHPRMGSHKDRGKEI